MGNVARLFQTAVKRCFIFTDTFLLSKTTGIIVPQIKVLIPVLAKSHCAYQYQCSTYSSTFVGRAERQLLTFAKEYPPSRVS